jgi:hypothetical protein
MDIVIVLLRLLHIVAAFAWFGLGGAVAFFIAPTVMIAGDNGYRFLKTLLTKTPMARLFAPMAGLTMLAGIIMYAMGYPNFTQLGNIVLGIGALAGIAAGIHGGALTGRATTALQKALEQHVPDNGQPLAADATAQLHPLLASMISHSRVSFALMAIALLGMGSARYL